MNRFTKIMIAFLTPTLAISIIIIIIVTSIAAGILSGGKRMLQAKKEDEIEETLEHFDISGSKKGNTYILNFEFTTWTINGIKVKLVGKKGSLNKKVKVPGLSGNKEDVVYKTLRRAGYSHEAACGIMGNIWAESGFITCAKEHNNFWTRGKPESARGYGLFQWTNTRPPYTRGRRTNVCNWLKSKGYDPFKDSNKLAEGQIKYMLIEKGYDRVRNKVKNVKDIDNATYIFLRGYEGIFNNATYAARKSKAHIYSKKYKNQNERKADTFRYANLNLNFDIKGKHITFSGELDGIPIAGNFDIKGSNISGSGEYGEGASAESNGGFSGTLSGANAKQKRIVKVALSYYDPWKQGYAHLCEGWVNRVYTQAGLHYGGSCCASHSRDRYATKKGKIPVGAAIYSGSSYRSSVGCSCGRNPGHVAIYVGNGMIHGSQFPATMTLTQFKRFFGYGGWYLPKN